MPLEHSLEERSHDQRYLSSFPWSLWKACGRPQGGLSSRVGISRVGIGTAVRGMLGVPSFACIHVLLALVLSSRLMCLLASPFAWRGRSERCTHSSVFATHTQVAKRYIVPRE